jgi:L-threonylcarbamoyladenylate synthase
MKTWLIDSDNFLNETTLSRLGAILRNGGLVVFPTETVYGIGANALDETAARRIYEVKGRPSDNPLIVHVADPEDAIRYVKELTEDARLLMKTYWPGPLTLILPKNDIVPLATTAGLSTVAIRCPRHLGARALIREAGVPIAAPSANKSGRPSATRFDHVKEDMEGFVDAIVDGGASEIGLESTVLDLTAKTPTILRPGAVTKTMLEATLNKPVAMGKLSSETEAPKSPGMKYVHYAPKGEVTVLYGPIDIVAAYVNAVLNEDATHRHAVLCASEDTARFRAETVLGIGGLTDSEAVGKELFSALREMDRLKIDRIYIPAFPEAELGAAIMNRLLKAAGYRTLRLDETNTKKT